MKRISPGLICLTFALSAVALAACAAGNTNTFTGTGNNAGSGASGNGGNSTTSTGVGALGQGGSVTIGTGGGTGTGGTGSGGGGVTYAYAHTNTQLYKFDPSAASISMQLVGTFDCIGSSSSSSSSSGGSGPTSCTEVDGTTGCCEGNTNYYCSSSNTVTSKACTSGEVCTWNATKGYYGCGTGPATASPSASQPIACQTSSSSSSSSSSSGSTTMDSSMTDLAVDSLGNLWGVSAHNAYSLTIQGSTVHCAKTIPLVGVPATFYGLSFVPKGVIDANAETLVAGDTAGDLWRIDQTTGQLEQHGNFGNVPADDGRGHNYPSDAAVTGATTTVGTPWQLSGDIVFLADTMNNGKPLGFVTVRDCVGTTCSNTDTLIQIDPTLLGTAGTPVTTNVTLGLRGQVVKSATCTDTTNATYGKMFGIAAWNSTIYGFSHDSYIVDISNVDGSACAVSGTNTNQAWSGAAVTTIAPVSAPPPPPQTM
jgi:hypothetical protein